MPDRTGYPAGVPCWVDVIHPKLDGTMAFYGDLFAHVVEWRGEYYLEDGLHRALRAALHQRNVLHARVHAVAG